MTWSGFWTVPYGQGVLLLKLVVRGLRVRHEEFCRSEIGKDGPGQL